MKRKLNLPFNNMSFDVWINLIIAALFTYFILYIGLPLIHEEWCASADFCGYYSAGQVINDGSTSDIYSLSTLGEYQEKLFSTYKGAEPDQEVIAMLYLPVFIWPFQFFARIDLPISLIVWLVMNFLGLSLYLVFFIKKVSENPFPLKILLLVLLSLPVFLNFHYGQVNVWLVICAGEFLRAIVTGKPYKAGLWLGGWLIKPHLLLLILPFLLIQKKYRVILGFILSSILLFGISFLLVGWDGFLGLKDSILEAVGGGASSGSEFMMNWRMLSFYVGYFTSPVIGWVFLGLASAVTVLLPLVFFRKKMDADSPRFAVALLGIMAATTIVSYHAHIHTAMIIIPFLLYLYLNEQLRRKIILAWVLIPDGVNFSLYLIGAMILMNYLPKEFAYIIELAFGSCMLVVNLILFHWSINQERLSEKTMSMKPSS